MDKARKKLEFERERLEIQCFAGWIGNHERTHDELIFGLEQLKKHTEQAIEILKEINK